MVTLEKLVFKVFQIIGQVLQAVAVIFVAMGLVLGILACGVGIKYLWGLL